MKYLSWPRKHKWLTFIALVALVALGTVAYYKISLELNRRAFQQASRAIDTIYADIVKEIGPPDDNEKVTSCTRPYVENPISTEGVLSCSISIDLFYAVEDEKQSDYVVTKMKSIIEKRQDLLRAVPKPRSDIVINPAPGATGVDNSISYYESSGGLLCTIKHTYDLPKQSLYLRVNCVGEANRQYYPLSSN